MSAFKVQVKKAVSPEALAAFSAGADAHQSTLPPIGLPALVDEPSHRRTESMLFRLSKEHMDEFNFVFEHTNVKSKQLLLEAIILPDLRLRAEKIRASLLVAPK